MIESLIAFVAGATFECLCVFWVWSTSQNAVSGLRPLLCSSSLFVAQRTGLAEALLSNHHWSATIACGIGYGFGAGLGVWLKPIKRTPGDWIEYFKSKE